MFIINLCFHSLLRILKFYFLFLKFFPFFKSCCRFPGEVDFWLLKLGLDLRTGGDEYKNSLQAARAAVKVGNHNKLKSMKSNI